MRKVAALAICTLLSACVTPPQTPGEVRDGGMSFEYHGK